MYIKRKELLLKIVMVPVSNLSIEEEVIFRLGVLIFN